MKSSTDKIHNEIGHGENRFDLALRYMSEKKKHEKILINHKNLKKS